MFQKLSIRSLLVTCLVLLATLTLFYSAITIVSVRKSLEEGLLVRAQNEVANLIQIQTIAHIPEEIFFDEDLGKTQNVFDEFFSEIDTSEVLRIKVWDTNARIIAANDPTIVGQKYPDNEAFQGAMRGTTEVVIKDSLDAESASEAGYGQLMEVYVPIMYPSGRIAGVVETYTILDSLNAQVRSTQKNLFVQLSIVFLPFLLLLGVVFILLYKTITKKITALVEFTKELGTGNLSKKISISSHDEIGEIAHAINKMSADLENTLTSKSDLEKEVQKRTQELHAVKKSLEKAVAERTAELENAKIQLEETVAERTRKLQEQLDNVQQLNKHMVNRELKLVELKDRIKELETKLGTENT